MILEYNEEQLDELLEIWLETNISAHSFIDENYWKSNYEMVRSMLPTASLFTYMLDGKIAGFVGVMEDGYIAGIFIRKEYQSRGLGKELLDYCKEIYPRLGLSVYSNNSSAVRFYERNGFVLESKSIDEDTMQEEKTMIWSR